MAEGNTEFLPFASAVAIVGAIQEEEHPRENNRRIFTVYDKMDRELCWFDAEETLSLVAPGAVNPKKEEVQPKLEEYILNHIPQWVME